MTNDKLDGLRLVINLNFIVGYKVREVAPGTLTPGKYGYPGEQGAGLKTGTHGKRAARGIILNGEHSVKARLLD